MELWAFIVGVVALVLFLVETARTRSLVTLGLAFFVASWLAAFTFSFGSRVVFR